LFVENTDWMMADLSRFFGLTTNTSTEAILSGRAWTHVPRPPGLEEAKQRIGRTGGKHHLSHLNDATVRQALSEYVEGHRSSVWLGGRLGVCQGTADQILKGKTWKHILRPEGFQYPWPDAASMNKRVGEQHGCTSLTNAQVGEVLRQVSVGELKTWQQVAEALGGLKKGAVYSLLKGKSWKHIERPEGFEEAVSRMGGKIPKHVEEEIISLIMAGGQKKEIQGRFGLKRTAWYRLRKEAVRRKESASAGRAE
jgi:hypothetical protein